MTFKICLQADGREFETTQTDSPRVARCAFAELLGRDDFLGEPVQAILIRGNEALYVSRFDQPLGAGRMHSEAPVDTYATIDRASELAGWTPGVAI